MQSYHGYTLFHKHCKTEQELRDYRDNGIRYPIAFYGEPFQSECTHHEWYMHTLWIGDDELRSESLKALTASYSDLTRALLQSQFAFVVTPRPTKKLEQKNSNDCDNTTSTAATNWRQSALYIVSMIEQESCAGPFRQPVDESVHTYYNIIATPMDLGTLRTALEDGSIDTVQLFIEKLYLIWQNAQRFNTLQEHYIHVSSKKLQKMSDKLIQQYLGEQGMRYRPRRRSSRKIQHDIASTLKCSHVQCGKSMRFMRGCLVQCVLNGCWKQEPKCRKCDTHIDDAMDGYYHCCDHADDDDDDDCKYSCTDGASADFLCMNCVDIGLDSGAHFNARERIFDAVFMSFDGDALLMQQQNDSVVITTLKSSPQLQKTKFVDFDQRQLNGAFRVQGRQYDSATLSADGQELSFRNRNWTQNEHKQQLLFTKIRPSCMQCEHELQLMYRNMLPSALVNTVYCDVHEQYYQSQKALQEDHHNTSTQLCHSFARIENENLNHIFEREFYFSCTQCKNFDICSQCVLIQTELKYRHEQQLRAIQEPPSKKRRRRRAQCGGDDVVDAAVDEMRARYEKEIRELQEENESLRNALDKEAERVQRVDQSWSQRYNELKAKVRSAMTQLQ